MKHLVFQRMLIVVVLAWATPATAANIDYGKITSGAQAFQKYWQLNDDEIRRYNLYMEAAGKYRHKDLNPLVVLSMIADSSEDKAYYAKKAAEYEHNMVMREIETAWLVSEAMGENYLSDAMQAFTDKLTGIDTLGYQPESHSTEWREGDRVVILLDGQCLTGNCVRQFAEVVQHASVQTQRLVIVRGNKPLEEEAVQLIAAWPQVSVHRYDSIEHHYLDDISANQALQVRDDEVVRVLPLHVEKEGEKS